MFQHPLMHERARIQEADPALAIGDDGTLDADDVCAEPGDRRLDGGHAADGGGRQVGDVRCAIMAQFGAIL